MIDNPLGKELESKTSQDYKDSMTKLGLDVEIPDQDLNSIGIKGSQESLKKIFRGIYDELAGIWHQDYEVDRGWNEISEGKQLRPGISMITIKSSPEEKLSEMRIVNVNGRDYVPFINEMHAAVKNSVIKAAKNL